MNRWLFIIFMLVVGCGDVLTNTETDVEDEPTIPLTLYMNREIDDGYYLVQYSGFNYTDVLFQTEGIQRVFWVSLDSFYVSYQDRIFSTPIIGNSTYSGTDGKGKQMVYINESFVGDTLTIYGCIHSENCKGLSFIIQ